MLRINTFGCLSVSSDAGEVSGAAAQPRRLAILAVLARAGDRGIRREKILALLWTDTEEEQARKTFAKALHALRRDLGVEEAVIGGMELRLNPELISSDVREFDTAVSEGQHEKAATLYAGPFLDGFRVPGAPEFERWAEVEREALARDYQLALEKVAVAEIARGHHAAAVRWLRKLVAQDPLNARHALRLMQCLSDAGDRLGALHHARVYEALVEQELDMPADRDVVALAERLRREQTHSHAERTAVEPAPNAVPIAVEPDKGAAGAELPAAEPAAPANWRRPIMIALAGVGLITLVAALASVWRDRNSAGRETGGVIAVGRIADYRQVAAPELARPLSDMLATNLARVPELRVLSTVRIYELLSAANGASDTTAAALVTAARRAGARHLVDGALFQVGDSVLRFDLRMMDLSNGNVIAAHSVTGANPFALVDSATALLVARAGVSRPTGSIADVSTRSIVAYRLYEEGLRAFTSGQILAADRLFQAASAEDSTFAMAAFYAARTGLALYQWPDVWERFARARRFAVRASDRERLLIELEFRIQSYAPTVRTLADSFITRFPHDVDGHLYAGSVAIGEGRFGDAIVHLRRVIAMDSLGRRTVPARCAGCEAMASLWVAYNALDSVDALVREARRWTAMQPQSATAWRGLAGALGVADRPEEALAALRTAGALSSRPDEPELQAQLRIRAGQFADADRDLRDAARSTERLRRAEMLWLLAISLRNQGRMKEALATAREFRRVTPNVDAVRGLTSTAAIAEAQVLFERGEYGRSAALFDSIATVASPRELESFAAKTRAWHLTHSATARAAAGDTVALKWMADTIRDIGARSYLARDQRLHHYVRGLLLTARGSGEDAVREFREAIWSPTIGFTRVNYELAKLYLRLGRPREAVDLLQKGLRGSLDAANFYTTRTELHELLGRAWLAAGRRDSAGAHLREVVKAWEHADPPYMARRDSALRLMGTRD